MTNQDLNQEVQQEQQEQVALKTFGETLLQELPSIKRSDVENCRKMSGAILNCLHLTLSHAEGNPLGTTLISQAINATIEAQMWTERALHFCDEVALDDDAVTKEEAKTE